MRGRRAALCAALWLTVAVRSAPAPAAPAASLRILVYAMTVASHTSDETHGGATIRRDVDDDGTLTIGVVAATGDGGLVVDAVYEGKVTVQPSIRVGVTADGRLLYDPQRALSAQAVRMLPYLARGFAENRDVSPGGTWTVAVPPPAQGATSYTVSTNADTIATITVAATIRVPGDPGSSEIDRGTLVYDLQRLCPKRYDIEATEYHSPSADRFVSTRAFITATLRSDTFA